MLQSVTKYYLPYSMLSVKIIWNCPDDCLAHLGGLKLKKSTLKLGEGGLYHNFFGRLKFLLMKVKAYLKSMMNYRQKYLLLGQKLIILLDELDIIRSY